MKKIASFDVFDTCIARRTAAPTDVFFKLATEVASAMHLEPTQHFSEAFVAARVNAESEARRDTDREEVSLSNICKNLSRALGVPDASFLMQKELDVEEELFFGVAASRQLVQSYRSKGLKIIFVSDTYFPRSFVVQQLRRLDFAQANDNIYCSSDVGLTKNTGSLFHWVVSQEQCAAGDILHHGDHQRSDYTVPRRLGMQAVRFSRCEPSKTERVLDQSQSRTRAATGAFVGKLREHRLAHRETGLTALVGQLIAPVLECFVRWVLEQSISDGIERLYFVSRDGQLALQVASVLAPQYDTRLECRYLYASRQALLFPSIERLTPAGLPWLRRDFECPAIASLLAKLELTVSDVKDELERAFPKALAENYVLRTESDWSDFWQFLASDAIQSKILGLVKTRREAAFAYFEHVGLFDKKRTAIVDLGWFLNGQAALNQLLKIRGGQAVAGYYLGLACAGRRSVTEAGHAKAMFYGIPPDRHPMLSHTSVFRCQTLLEHVLGIANHASVRHYRVRDGEPEPVCRNPIGEAQTDFAKSVTKETLRFVSMQSPFGAEQAATIDKVDTVDCILRAAVESPSKMLIEPLMHLHVETDQNGLDSHPLIAPITWRSALVPAVPSRFRRSLWSSTYSPWPEASALVSSPLLRHVKENCIRIARARASCISFLRQIGVYR